MRLGAWVLIALAGTAIAVAAVVVTGRAIWAQPEPTVATQPSAPLPDLYIADDKLDLGEVWESRDAVLTVPISNRSDKPIEILDFESSCDCGEISPRRLMVPANGSAMINVKMDLANRTENNVSLRARTRWINLTAMTDAKSNKVRLNVQCTIVSAITTNYASIHFGDSNRQGSASVSRKMKIALHQDISELRISNINNAIFISHNREEGGSIELVITPNTNRGAGAWTDRIVISYRLPNDRRCCHSIEVTGNLILPL